MDTNGIWHRERDMKPGKNEQAANDTNIPVNGASHNK